MVTNSTLRKNPSTSRPQTHFWCIFRAQETCLMAANIIYTFLFTQSVATKQNKKISNSKVAGGS